MWIYWNFDLTVSEHLDLNLNIHILQHLGKAKMLLEEYLSYLVMLKRIFYFKSLYCLESFLKEIIVVIALAFCIFMLVFSRQRVLHISVLICVCVIPGHKKCNSGWLIEEYYTKCLTNSKQVDFLVFLFFTLHSCKVEINIRGALALCMTMRCRLATGYLSRRKQTNHPLCYCFHIVLFSETGLAGCNGYLCCIAGFWVVQWV